MYLKGQYLDYALYKTNRLSDLFFNDAKRLYDDFDNNDSNFGDIVILFHQSLLLNKNNMDAQASITHMIDINIITPEQSKHLKKVAYLKLKERSIQNLNTDNTIIDYDLIDFKSPLFYYGKVTTDSSNIVHIIFNEPIAENFNISTNDFNLFINNNNSPIHDISVDNSGNLLLSLNTPIREQKFLKIQYTRDLINTNNNINDRAGNHLLSFGPIAISNLVDTTPPFFINGLINPDSPHIITIEFTEHIFNNENININNFTCIADNYSVDITNFTINDNFINITIANTITSGMNVNLSYLKTNNIYNNITDLVGNELDTFLYNTIINNIPPVFQNGFVEDNFPNKIIINFDSDISTNNTFDLNTFSIKINTTSIDINSIVVNNDKDIEIIIGNNILTGENVTITYTKIDDSAHNIIDDNGNAVLSFIDKQIINYLAPKFKEGYISNQVNNNISIIFDENIKDINTSLNINNDFKVFINTNQININEVIILNGIVNISISEYVSSMEEVIIQYIKNESDLSKNLTNYTDIPVKTFTTPIQNRVAPILISKTVFNGTPNTIIIDFDVDISANDICGNDFQTNITGYKFSSFPITEYSPAFQSTLNIVRGTIFNGNVYLELNGIVNNGAIGYIQYTYPGDTSNQKLTDLSGNYLRTNSLLYNQVEPYNWITNQVQPVLLGGEIVQHVTNPTTNQEYNQGIILHFDPHFFTFINNSLSYEIFVNGQDPQHNKIIIQTDIFETNDSKYTSSTMKTLLIIMQDIFNYDDTFTLKYYQNNNTYTEYTEYTRNLNYREYSGASKFTEIIKQLPILATTTTIMNKLPPFFVSGQATNADLKRIILTFNSTINNSDISPGNFIVKINELDTDISSVGVFDNSNSLFLKMKDNIIDEGIIHIYYIRNVSTSILNVQGIYNNDISSFDNSTNIINTIDSIPPNLISTELTDPNTILFIFSEPIAPNNDICGNNFNITNNDLPVIITSAIVTNNGTVIISLQDNITSMENIKFKYDMVDMTELDHINIRDIHDNRVLDYPNNVIVNNTIPPIFVSGTTLETTKIEITFDVNISINTNFNLNDFTVLIEGITSIINNINIVNGKIIITLDQEVTSMQNLTFNYIQNADSNFNIKDDNGNPSISFTNPKIILNTIPPIYSTLYNSVIYNDEPHIVKIPFNVPLASNNNLLSGNFSLQRSSGSVLTISSVIIDISGILELNFTAQDNLPVTINDVILFYYTKPNNLSNQLKDDNGNAVDNISNKSVDIQIQPYVTTAFVLDDNSYDIHLVFNILFNIGGDICGNDLNLKVNGVNVDVSSVELGVGTYNGNIIVKLYNAILSNEEVIVRYIKPSIVNNQITFNSAFTNLLPIDSFNNDINVINYVKPLYISSSVRNDFFNKENEILITYNADLSNNSATLDKDKFSVYKIGYSNTEDHFIISSIEIINNKIKIILEYNNGVHYVQEGDEIVVNYYASPVDDIQNVLIDQNNNMVNNFTIQPNNLILVRPTITSATVYNGYNFEKLSGLLPQNKIVFTLNTPREIYETDICENNFIIKRQYKADDFDINNNYYESGSMGINSVLVNTNEITIITDVSLNWYEHFKYNYTINSASTKNIIDVSNILLESLPTYETLDIYVGIHPLITMGDEFNTMGKTMIISSIDTEQKRILFYEKINTVNVYNERIEYFQDNYIKEKLIGNLTRSKKYKIYPYPPDTNTPDYSGSYINQYNTDEIIIQFHEGIEPNENILKTVFMIDVTYIDTGYQSNVVYESIRIDASGQIILTLNDGIKYSESVWITYNKLGDSTDLFDAQGNVAENIARTVVDVSRIPEMVQFVTTLLDPQATAYNSGTTISTLEYEYVAISGVYAMYGNFVDNVNGVATGAFFVFEYINDAWIFVVKMHASDFAPGDQFGAPLALDGTYAIAGAAAGSNNSIGSAYIYERGTNGYWGDDVPNEVYRTETQKLIPSDGIPFKQFGRAVAISGTTAMVGQTHNNIGGIGGAVYIYERDVNGVWGTNVSGQSENTETVKLQESTVGWYRAFGKYLDLNGDYSVIGAPGYTFGTTNAAHGGAYIFERNINGYWGTEVVGQIYRTETQLLLPSDPKQYGIFGTSVAISGNYAVIGSRYSQNNYASNSNNNPRGGIYVYERDVAGNWGVNVGQSYREETVKLLPSDWLADGASYSMRVGISGKYIIVGIYKWNGELGSGYLYERNNNGEWGRSVAGEVYRIETHKFDNTAHWAGYFGSAVDIDGTNIMIGVIKKYEIVDYVWGTGIDMFKITE